MPCVGQGTPDQTWKRDWEESWTKRRTGLTPTAGEMNMDVLQIGWDTYVEGIPEEGIPEEGFAEEGFSE